MLSSAKDMKTSEDNNCRKLDFFGGEIGNSWSSKDWGKVEKGEDTD